MGQACKLSLHYSYLFTRFSENLFTGLLSKVPIDQPSFQISRPTFWVSSGWTPDYLHGAEWYDYSPCSILFHWSDFPPAVSPGIIHLICRRQRGPSYAAICEAPSSSDDGPAGRFNIPINTWPLLLSIEHLPEGHLHWNSPAERTLALVGFLSMGWAFRYHRLGVLPPLIGQNHSFL